MYVKTDMKTKRTHVQNVHTLEHSLLRQALLTFFTPGKREGPDREHDAVVEHEDEVLLLTATVTVVFVTLGDGRIVGMDPARRFLFALKPS
jgi:hypothetical protein